ncbi:CheW protein [Leptolyngbya boryana NIES-2135]|jgi:chemotaxis signal transduction protein|uniref:CheW protein n=1 Tax=Leptolyngbya boryana NIES-2135 TaxID=1973484 RepID=A0A1Z4JHY3_LEPBY|nr:MULTISPECIES: chemotaxis protein CheW [Leptolyngbya]BAY56385.1 CheW protein [Leptolyngbya boryana NIES-2135]MBD2366491.1 chemotaxis protein CheW [Leptolyngbya sp. FACHB-161]MBD2372670.1 chemotaxis protein CheW [Leptolyngbya sp. FACHB-238]MBD2397093.1 chemotaxis protein CheW [Leptolyngbya sp. FACHB-239]MBD2403617.1 chemotaxis protein CheW [Leptolyngbya sp. FACHB-402]
MTQVIEHSQTTRQMMRLVVFTIAGYRFGLPLESILRVVNVPEELKSSASGMLEVVPVGEYTLTVLNLRSQLSMTQGQTQAVSTRSQAEFLVVTQVETELCALRVDAPPDLIEIDAAAIRQLPAPYRQGHPLSIASHVVVLPQGKATLAIFLLEMKRVLALSENSLG